MENIMKKNQSRENDKLLVIYFGLFYFCWTVKEIVFSIMVGDMFKSILSGFIKILIWVLPVLIIIKMSEKQSILKHLKFKTPSLKAITYILIVVIFALLFKIGILEHSIKEISLNNWINTIILAGLTEEIVFRGFLLTRLAALRPFWHANMVSSILFVSIHFPIWYVKDISIFDLPLLCINIFVILSRRECGYVI